MYMRIEALLITFTQANARIEKQDSKQILVLTAEFLFDLMKEVYNTAKDSVGANLSKGLQLVIGKTLEKKLVDQDYSKQLGEFEFTEQLGKFTEQLGKSLKTHLQMKEEVATPLIQEDYFLDICGAIVKFACNSAFSKLSEVKQLNNQNQERTTMAELHDTQSLEEVKVPLTQPEDEVLIFEVTKQRKRDVKLSRKTKSMEEQKSMQSMNSGSWQPDEIQRFEQALSKYRRDFKKIMEHVRTRSYRSIKNRFHRHVKANGALKPGPITWTVDENQRFVEAVRLFGDDRKQISDFVGSKSVR